MEIWGRVAIEPDLEVCDGGARRLRILVTTRSDEPRTRIDVIPVVVWDPPGDLLDGSLVSGTRLRITGKVQRRVWETPEGLRSRLEVVGVTVERAPIHLPL